MTIAFKALQMPNGWYFIMSGGNMTRSTPRICGNCLVSIDDTYGMSMLETFSNRYGGKILEFSLTQVTEPGRLEQ